MLFTGPQAPSRPLVPHPHLQQLRRGVLLVSASTPPTQEFEDCFPVSRDCQSDGRQAGSPPSRPQPHSAGHMDGVLLAGMEQEERWNESHLLFIWTRTLIQTRVLWLSGSLSAWDTPCLCLLPSVTFVTAGQSFSRCVSLPTRKVESRHHHPKLHLRRDDLRHQTAV